MTDNVRWAHIRGMKLADYLAREGLTHAAFGARIGRPHSTIYRIAHGQLEPRPELRATIVAATNGEVTELDLLKRVATAGDESEAA